MWNPFRKKAELLVMPPAAWDGIHRLTDIIWVQEASYPDDFHAGYRWLCACGTMSPSLPTRWYHTEGLAAQGHKRHAEAYEEASKRHWGPRPAFYPVDPRG